MVNKTIPFVDLVAEWSPLRADALARIARVFEHGRFVMGPEVLELETRLAEEVGVRHALAVSSGTTALLIALMAIELEPGDEVILPAFTFAAPLETVLLLGAIPVLADIDPGTCLIDVDQTAQLIGPKTRAIIAVSLYGQPADVPRLVAIAAPHGIAVIEDAAQSFGASLAGKPSGSLGAIGCMSFYPTKPIGGAGDGGALLTDDAALAKASREIRDHGQSGKYDHVRLGLNGRLDSISCAALLVRLGAARQAIAQRRAVAQRYDALLADAAKAGLLRILQAQPEALSACAHYVVEVSGRDEVVTAMRGAGIEVAVHYPEPLHHQPAYRDRVSFRSLANVEAAARRVLCLPIYPTLAPAQQERVAAALIGALAGGRR